MLLTIEREEVSLTYECRHAGVTKVLPESEAVRERGDHPCARFDLVGISSITRKTQTAKGFDVDDVPVTAKNQTLELPRDGDAAYFMNAGGKTTDIIRWPLKEMREEVAV